MMLKEALNVLRWFVETMHRNKRLFTHPWPTMYMHFYKT
jgi:hypothetical protein